MCHCTHLRNTEDHRQRLRRYMTLPESADPFFLVDALAGLHQARVFRPRTRSDRFHLKLKQFQNLADPVCCLAHFVCAPAVATNLKCHRLCQPGCVCSHLEPYFEDVQGLRDHARDDSTRGSGCGVLSLGQFPLSRVEPHHCPSTKSSCKSTTHTKCLFRSILLTRFPLSIQISRKTPQQNVGDLENGNRITDLLSSRIDESVELYTLLKRQQECGQKRARTHAWAHLLAQTRTDSN